MFLHLPGRPSGFQQFLFFFGWTTLFWIVGQVGTLELAAATVLINVTLIAILPGLGLGMAAGTLVGQSLGRAEAGEAQRWGWDTVRVGAVFTLFVAIPMLVAPDLVLAIFLHDTVTVEAATLPLRIVGVALLGDVAGLVLYGALAGAGDARRLLVASAAMQWGLALPAAWLVGPQLGYGLVGIWLVVSAWRLLQGAVYGLLWHRGAWAAIRL